MSNRRSLFLMPLRSAFGPAAITLVALLLAPTLSARAAELPTHDIYFATNRTPPDDENASWAPQVYDRVVFGKCVVSVPGRYHKRGRLEFNLTEPETNPSYWFCVRSTERMSGEKLAAETRGSAILVVVHGYATTFDKAICQAAQLRHDTGFQGRVVLFSWPSWGDKRAYRADERNAKQSDKALADVLLLLKRSEGDTEKTHCIAHSMGNRVLISSLGMVAAQSSPADGKLFGQTILVAPDLAQKDFERLVEPAIRLSEQTTHYYCTRDVALTAAEQINEVESAGLAACTKDGLHTICVDAADLRFPSHNYHIESHAVLDELGFVFRNLPVTRRATLLPDGDRPGGGLWHIVVTPAAQKTGE
jgi:esterase/lipase superfamily enzyme